MRYLSLFVCLSLLSTRSQAKMTLAAPEPPVPTSPPIYVKAAVKDVNCLQIAFPSIALQEAPEGVTTLSILISPEGVILSGGVTQSSGSHALDNAAVTGLRGCLFKPATNANVPQYSWTIFQYVWKHDAADKASPLVPLPEGMNKPPVYGTGPFYIAPSSGLPEGAVT